MTGVTFLVVLCALLALVSVAARYVSGVLLNTDRYVAAVAPLGDDPTIENNVIERVTAVVSERLDLENIADDALNALIAATPAERPRIESAVRGLAPVVASQLEQLVEQIVTGVVESDQFAGAWTEANRAAHRGVVIALTGQRANEADLVVVDDEGVVSIPLAPIVDRVTERLDRFGFSLSDNIPDTDQSITVMSVPNLAVARSAVRALDALSIVLPLLALLAAAAAIILAGTGHRRRVVIALGVSLAVAMAVLAVGVVVGRSLYLDALPPGTIVPSTAAALFDALVGPLRSALRAVGVLGLIVAFAAFMSGNSRAATGVRSGIGRGVGAFDRRGPRPPTDFERWVADTRTALRIAIVAVAALAVMFWARPTAPVVIVVAVLAVVALSVVDLVARPAVAVEAIDVVDSGGSAAAGEAAGHTDVAGSVPGSDNP